VRAQDLASYAERRAAGEDGHGMARRTDACPCPPRETPPAPGESVHKPTCELYEPALAPGVRVRTADPLTCSYAFAPEFNRDRRAGATGAIREITGHGRHASYQVRHDDGTEAPYDRDELTPIGGAS
jgi:hypothetical protein